MKPIYDSIMEGTSFLPEGISFSVRVGFFLSQDSIPLCPVCTEPRMMIKGGSGFAKTCGKKECKDSHMVSKIKSTYAKNYGTENIAGLDSIKEKRKKTNLERYGCENPMQSDEVLKHFIGSKNSEETKNKRKETIRKTYEERGEEIKESRKNTNLEKYGVITPSKNESVKNKIKNTHKEKYGGWWVTTEDGKESRVRYLNSKKKEKQKISKILDNLEYSNTQRDITEFISSLGFEVQERRRDIIPSGELDIFIPEKNIAIEYNGVYWHSSANFYDKNKHQNKALECQERGIQLIHVWSDDWNGKKKNIIKNKIKSKLGISEKLFARKCEIFIPDSKEVREFYDRNHIQGYAYGGVNIALKYEGNMIACVSFKNKSGREWELIRYATSLSVVGGFTKLLSYFKKNFEWNLIFTFAHLDYSHGNLYEASGFEKIKVTKPGLWYTKGTTRERREKYMKHKLKAIFENFDPNLTEEMNMRNNGFYQIFDAGSIRYQLNLS